MHATQLECVRVH